MSMYFVYILKCGDGKLYIGYSENLRQRLRDHENGLVESTRSRQPLSLFYYEAYNSDKAARGREAKLKQFGSSYQGLIKRLGLE